jgi:diguanylate cyclase (GGDEF)-like protein
MHSVSLIMFDIDRFKHVNDTYGHQVGDVVLRTVSQHIGRQIRSSDIFARYGGEEFAIILPETSSSGAEVKAERCRELVEGLQIKVGNHTIPVTISIGVAAYEPDHPTQRAQLIDAADRAMYRSKSDGRNRVTVFTWHDLAAV